MNSTRKGAALLTAGFCLASAPNPTASLTTPRNERQRARCGCLPRALTVAAILVAEEPLGALREAPAFEQDAGSRASRAVLGSAPGAVGAGRVARCGDGRNEKTERAALGLAWEVSSLVVWVGRWYRHNHPTLKNATSSFSKIPQGKKPSWCRLFPSSGDEEIKYIS